MSSVEMPIELLLASASPRRRQIIGLLGLPYRVAVASDEEEAAQARYKGPADELAEWLARHKASAALKLPEASGRLIVTADTTVVLEKTVLGKPRNQEHAFELLSMLRGRWHQVITGVVVCSQETNIPVMRSARCITPVLMRDYSDAEIVSYIATGDPMDKAGSYGIQHASFQPTERINGCYFNVVGLPLCTLARLLAEAGVILSRQPVAIQEGAGCPWSEKCHI